MAKIEKGKVWVKWGDGKERVVGEITVTADLDAVHTGMRMKWLRFGWEMVKAGLRMMRRSGWPEGDIPDIGEKNGEM